MMIRFIIPLTATVLAAVHLVGCSPLAPRSDPTQFFVLTSLAERGASESHVAMVGLSLGLGPITIPAYLARAQIVTRVGENRVEYSEYHRWAVSLEEGFLRAVSENLSVLLTTDQIVDYPWYRSTPVDYAVEIDVLRFERVPAGHAEFASRWTIRDGDSGRALEARESMIQEPADSMQIEASVAALSRALAELSRDIAAAIRRLEQQRSSASPTRQPR